MVRAGRGRGARAREGRARTRLSPQQTPSRRATFLLQARSLISGVVAGTALLDPVELDPAVEPCSERILRAASSHLRSFGAARITVKAERSPNRSLSRAASGVTSQRPQRRRRGARGPGGPGGGPEGYRFLFFVFDFYFLSLEKFASPAYNKLSGPPFHPSK